jgi:glycosyltransferase involved in cell wall biosynthesis
MHIALFNQYHCNPDCPATCRHYTFLEYLARRHRITLITTNTWSSQRLSNEYPWVPDGVELHAFDVSYGNQMGVAQRFLSFAHFALKAFIKGNSLPKPDVIWAVSTPLTVAWVAGSVARKQKVPWVFEVQDLWPSFPIEMGAVPGKWLQNRLFGLEKRLYQQADHIIALSPDMNRFISERGIPSDKISLLLNGTDFNLIEKSPDPDGRQIRQQYGIGNRKVVLYAGTFGRANDIPLLIATAKLLQGRLDICFVFTGSGYYASQLREASLANPSLIVIPPQARHSVFSLFRLASLSLVSFLDLPVLNANSPAKFFDSLAVGTPVLVTNNGWTRAFVEKNGCGWFVPPGNAPALAKEIIQAIDGKGALEEAGRNGLKAAMKGFDRQRQAIEIERILQQVILPVS